MIKVVVCGALGKMGRIMVDEIVGDAELSLAGAVEAPGHPGLARSSAESP
jgi:dihydrodipicolinate reductase